MWEENLLTNLLEDLGGYVRSQGLDRWSWRLEGNECFSVKSMYLKLERLMLDDNRCSEEERRVFRQIWKSGAPSKVVAFSWKLLHDRIPTSVNLDIRHCLPTGVAPNCSWCGTGRESSIHLFLHCDLEKEIWLRLMRWTNRWCLIPLNLFIFWECWNMGGYHKKIQKGRRLIWQAAIWVMWKARNDRVFNEGDKGVEDLVEEIQVLSWRWLLGRMDFRHLWCMNGSGIRRSA